VEFGEDLISLVCLELNARALVSGWKYENLDGLNVGWLGVFIAPTTKLAVWCRLAVVWCTGQSGESRWVLTVGALTSGPALMSGGASDMYCRVSGVPAWACLTSVRAGAHLMRRR
jgi:hypothetical protein